MIDVVPATPSWRGAAGSPDAARGRARHGAAGGQRVVKRDAWEKVDAPGREKLMAAARLAEEKLKVEVPKQDASAIEEMRSRGLSVVTVGAGEAAVWRSEAEAFTRAAREEGVPPDILQATRETLAALRGAGGAKP
jgi:TRAP-type C4-dicarboxylate transport system substrate-binding protein